MLDVDPVTFDRAYNGVANSTLWFVAHLLYATAESPVFDARTRREWRAYQEYDDAFAAALAAAAAPGAAVLVQDYHLALTPRQLRERRPDLRIGHFSHTPWAPPEYFCLLPDDVAREVLLGHARRGRRRLPLRPLGRRLRALLRRGARRVVRRRALVHEGRTTRVSVHPLGVDPAELRQRAAQDDVQSRLPGLRELVGDRQLLLRIDRTELSKNIVRGLEAYRELLRTRPQWRGRVVHLAFAYPSRHDLPEYREYTGAVQRVAREVNEEFATEGWVPVHLEVRDDYPRSLAAYALADVLLVNPLRDGMNLVAKEGPVLSERGLSLVLSRQAGAADELGEWSHLVNPYDVAQTAEALHAALSRPPRSARAGPRRSPPPPPRCRRRPGSHAQLAALP